LPRPLPFEAQKVETAEVKMKALSRESLGKLADAHIRMYADRLTWNSPVVRGEETARYLAIWQTIKDCQSYESLTLEARDEVEDARTDGGYDNLLLPAERENDP
jgi:hypothetical protein